MSGVVCLITFFTFLTRLFFCCPVFVGQLADTRLNLKIATVP
jgi:hypothetical protein